MNYGIFTSAVLIFGIFATQPVQATDLGSILQELQIPHQDDGQCRLTRSEAVNQLLSFLPQKVIPQLAPDLHCLAFEKHLSHDQTASRELPSPREIYQSKDFSSKLIEGKIEYVGLSKRAYRYRVTHFQEGAQSKFNVEVKIYVNQWKIWNISPLRHYPKEVAEKTLKHMFDLVLADVSKLWSLNDSNVRFQITRVDSPEDADFSIALRQGLGSDLYDSHWNWTPYGTPDSTDEQIKGIASFDHDVRYAAHEVGHMMGLEDEYSLSRSVFSKPGSWIESITHAKQPKEDSDTPRTDVKVRGCDVQSLMCKDWESPQPLDYQVYLILRRFLNS